MHSAVTRKSWFTRGGSTPPLSTSLYYYPKSNTDMFDIACRLRKLAGDRRLSDSDMPPAKAQRRQVRNSCHFDQREKTLLDPSHSLGMTGIGPTPLRLGAFAGDNPAFGCAVRRQANLFFPARYGEKRVGLWAKQE
jgi:hypothetical protein